MVENLRHFIQLITNLFYNVLDYRDCILIQLLFSDSIVYDTITILIRFR